MTRFVLNWFPGFKKKESLANRIISYYDLAFEQRPKTSNNFSQWYTIPRKTPEEKFSYELMNYLNAKRGASFYHELAIESNEYKNPWNVFYYSKKELKNELKEIESCAYKANESLIISFSSL